MISSTLKLAALGIFAILLGQWIHYQNQPIAIHITQIASKATRILPIESLQTIASSLQKDASSAKDHEQLSQNEQKYLRSILNEKKRGP